MSRRVLRVAAAVLAAVVVGAGLQTLAPQPVRADSSSPDVFSDFKYPETVREPTADKPQSKLWYAYDAWWGLLADKDDGAVHIFRLADRRGWRDTDTLVDDRAGSTGDVLWDGSTAYVASRVDDGPLQVSRFSFDPGDEVWSRDGPVDTIDSGGSASATIAKDSLGRLWLTYTESAQVWVAHTTVGDRGWTAPFQPAVTDTLVNPDDISAVVSFDGAIGVMWSDQDSDRYTFAVHSDRDADSVWTEEGAGSGFLEVDDHINLQTASSANGTRVLAAVKTSLDRVSGVPASATQIAVLVRSPRGTWKTVPAGLLADGHTRPLLVVDSSNEQVYLVAAAAGLGVFYKRSPLDHITFPEGRGEPLLESSLAPVDNPTSSKAPVTSDSGLVVLASAGPIRRYFHAAIDLPDPEPDDGRAPAGPAAVVAEPTEGCSVNLIWPPGTDEGNVLRYQVDRDGFPLASTTDETYTDSTAGCGSTHQYAVSAVDEAGNESPPTTSGDVGTPDPVQRGGPGIWLTGTSAAVDDRGRSITVPIPATRPGDVLLASFDAVGVRGSLNPPPGWRLVRRDLRGSALLKETYLRVAAANEPANALWRGGRRGSSVVANTLAYRGVSTADPVASAAGRSNKTGTSVATPSVAVDPSDAVVGLYGVAGLVAVTPPAEMVGHTSQSATKGPRQRVTGSTADRLDTTLATGTMDATASHAWPSIGQLVVLRAEAAEIR